MAEANSLDELYKLLNKGKVTSESGGVTTSQTQLSSDTVSALIKQALESNGGLSSILSSQAGSGLYNSSTNKLLTDDLVARIGTNVAAQAAPKVTTVTPRTTTVKNQSMTGKDYAGLLMGMVGKGYGDKFLKSKNPIDTVKGWFGGESGGGALGGGTTSVVTPVANTTDMSNVTVSELSALSQTDPNELNKIVDPTTSETPPPDTSSINSFTSSILNTNSGATSTGLESTSVPALNTLTGDSNLNTISKATTDTTFGDMFAASKNANYSNVGSEASAGAGAAEISSAPTEYAVTDSEAYIDSGGMGQGSGSSSSSSGNYLSAVTGALGGYAVGEYNSKTDPAMSSGEDGFGKYHKDRRAEVGGATLGAFLGYEGGAIGSSIAPAVVNWFHPYAQDMTRDVINFGDDIGGPTGAMLLDPAGASFSGKYSDNELLTAPLGAGAGPLASNVVEEASSFIDKNCFITTAVCRQLGKADDCEELVAMRKLRDEYALVNGYKEEVNEYYEKAPKIVEAIRSNPSADRIFNDFYNLYIVPAVAAVHLGQYEKAHTIYRNLFNHALEVSGV